MALYTHIPVSDCSFQDFTGWVLQEATTCAVWPRAGHGAGCWLAACPFVLDRCECGFGQCGPTKWAPTTASDWWTLHPNRDCCGTFVWVSYLKYNRDTETICLCNFVFLNTWLWRIEMPCNLCNEIQLSCLHLALGPLDASQFWRI